VELEADHSGSLGQDGTTVGEAGKGKEGPRKGLTKKDNGYNGGGEERLMARLNPRLRVRKSGENVTSAYMAGIPCADFDLFMELVVEYGAGEFGYLVDQIVNYTAPNSLLSISRHNGTVTVEVKATANRHAIQGLFHIKTLASLALYYRAEKLDGKTYELLRDRSTPMGRMDAIIKMLDHDSDRERQEEFYPEYMRMRALSTATPLEKSRRMDQVKADRKFRIMLDDTISKTLVERARAHAEIS
jgi:hypothetical protein